MRIDLNGKKALVGGSTGGIGKAIALELSKCGANVFTNDVGSKKNHNVQTKTDR